jgi:hypothetical protein
MAATMGVVMRILFALFVMLMPFAANAAGDMPARKAGLWQMTMSIAGHGMPQQTMKQCIDAATDKTMNTMGGQMSKEACSKQDIKHVGNTVVVDSVCKMGPHTATSHAVVTGDFNSAYTVKVESKQDGPPVPGMPGGAMKMTIAAKWLGPCTGDQKPGDMIMGNGMKMNIRDMPGATPRR